MYRVAESILNNQIDFFEKGPAYMKPMILKQIAEKLKLHESTISRSTKGKYCQTPFGLFEFKYFFSSALETSKHLLG